MKAVVVYESHFGNTAAVARAIAEGIGDARALNTDEATPEAIDDAELIVAGAPVIAFGLSRDGMKAQIEAAADKAPTHPDVAHPLLRTWLDRLPPGPRLGAAFETRIWWSPRGATGTIESRMKRIGYRIAGKPERFIVAGGYGPLRDGELDRARVWGASLAKAAGIPSN
jgi:flavorubredoxin